jgi:UPF0716 protein FxsA
MFFKLFLFFSVIPVMEIAILIQIGSYIGIPVTIAIVILTAVIGAFLVRQEGMTVIFKLRQKIQEGIMPADEIIDGVMILTSGALLLTPGFTTDIIGLLLVLPPSRRFIKKLLTRYLEKKFFSMTIDSKRNSKE